MDTAQLLDRTLASFASNYDITRDAQVASRRVEALAQLRAMNSRYMLSKKWVVWQANAFEHCIFVTAPVLTADMVRDWFSFLTEEAEKELVHPGADVPPEGHMYSYLTVVYLCGRMEPEAAKAVRRLRFTKNYRFSLRGWATGRALAVETSTGKMAFNAQGKEMRRHFQRLLKERPADAPQT
ncbi:MAG: hypothetical protein ACI4ML_14515 [Aristaeellaceae bacterium]